MSIDETAEGLARYLKERDVPGITSIGVREEARLILVYVDKLRSEHRAIPSFYGEFRVETRYLRSARPAAKKTTARPDGSTGARRR